MSEPLSAEEIEGLREHEGHPLLGVCPLDMQQRPCRTARWLATLDAARAASPAAPMHYETVPLRPGSVIAEGTLTHVVAASPAAPEALRTDTVAPIVASDGGAGGI